jgi:hypothetical protein
LEHALSGTLGDDEAIEHIDVGSGAAADSRHQLGRVSFVTDHLHQLGLHIAVLAVEVVDDHLQATQFWLGGDRPEGN